MDGIDTGIKLSDFPNGNTPVTNTVSGDLTADVANQIFAKLKEDGKLAATMKDSTPFGAANGNIDIFGFSFPLGNLVTIPAANQATLKLDAQQTTKIKKKKKRR